MESKLKKKNKNIDNKWAKEWINRLCKADQTRQFDALRLFY